MISIEPSTAWYIHDYALNIISIKGVCNVINLNITLNLKRLEQILLGRLTFQLPTRKQISLNRYATSIARTQWFGHPGHATVTPTKAMIQIIHTTCLFAIVKIRSDIEFKPVQRIQVAVLAKCTQGSDPPTLRPTEK